MKTLIALVGRSPAVLTCTLHALATEDPPFWPDKVVVVTTQQGQEATLQAMFTPRSGGKPPVLVSLAAVLRKPELPLSNHQQSNGLSFAIPGVAGVRDKDAHQEDELHRMGAIIYKHLYEATRHVDDRVMLSLSGGRKSMAHLAGTAMSLLGRPGKDELLHVLVEPDWLENDPGFVYPGCITSQHIEKIAREGEESRRIKSSNVKTHLSRVPYLALSGMPKLAALTEALGRSPTSFRHVIELSNVELAGVPRFTLTYCASRFELRLNGSPLNISGDRRFALLTSLLLVARHPGKIKAVLDEAGVRLRMRIWQEVLRPGQKIEDNSLAGHQLTSADAWTKAFSSNFVAPAPTVGVLDNQSLARLNPMRADTKPQAELNYSLSKDITLLNEAIGGYFHGLAAPNLIGINLMPPRGGCYQLGSAMKFMEEE
jgi:CRISPR-associated protein (TIGR02584 family)